MQVMKKNGVSLAWPEGLEDIAEEEGFTSLVTVDIVHTNLDEPHVKWTSEPEGIVEIRLPQGTKSTDVTLKTPKWMGSEKWFTKKKLTGYYHDGVCWVIRLPRKDLKQRGLDVLLDEE